MIDIKGFHLELTNKCYLKCPRCARTTFIEKFGIKSWDNHDLNFEDLKSFLDIDIAGLQMNMCGNDGDPIYHPDFLQIVRWFKDQQAVVNIHTNGSYKSKEWWIELASTVDTNDTITFAIDGTPENFTDYRVNADWSSIKTGLDVMIQSEAKVVWKMIPFKFNENDVEIVKTYALTLGVNDFIISCSDRWIGDDPLQPDNKYLGDRHISITNWKNNKILRTVNPKCTRKKTEHFITSSGYYTPCCYMASWQFYYKTEFYKNKNTYDISKTTISEILSNKNVINFYNNIHEAKLPVCTYNCPKT